MYMYVYVTSSDNNWLISLMPNHHTHNGGKAVWWQRKLQPIIFSLFKTIIKLIGTSHIMSPKKGGFPPNQKSFICHQRPFSPWVWQLGTRLIYHTNSPVQVCITSMPATSWCRPCVSAKQTSSMRDTAPRLTSRLPRPPPLPPSLGLLHLLFTTSQRLPSLLLNSWSALKPDSPAQEVPAEQEGARLRSLLMWQGVWSVASVKSHKKIIVQM